MTDYMENLVIDSMFRPGRSSLWLAATSYSYGAFVYGNNATAVGKIFECVIAGVSGSTQPTWNGFNFTTTDGTATWITWNVGLPKKALYVALFTNSPIDDLVPVEVTAPSYARILKNPTINTSWTTTQGDISPISTGTSGSTLNNTSITYPSPLENWGTIKSFGVYDTLTGGNLLFWSPLTISKVVNASDPAPSFAPQSLEIQIDDDVTTAS